MKKYIVLYISFCFLSFIGKSQSNLNDGLNTYYNQSRQGQPVIDISKKLLKFNNDDLLFAISNAVNDTSMDKRLALYKLLNFIGHETNKSSFKKQAIKQLINGLSDRDGGIIGLNLQYITTFELKDFDTELKYKISEQSKTPQPHYEMFIKICGWLGNNDMVYEFRNMISEKKGDVKSRWAMRLAMARMGEPDMVDYCLGRIQKIPVGDDMVYEIVPDIIYTRQKVLFDYLLKVIESDAKNCSSPNPASNTKFICAFRIIEQLAPYIEDFPVSADTSGDLKEKNYDKALTDVRKWIIANRETYKIRESVYY